MVLMGSGYPDLSGLLRRFGCRLALIAVNLLFFFVVILAALDPSEAVAQERLSVEQGKSILLPNVANIETVFISDTDVADATVSPNNQIFVYGKAVGETSLIATALDGSMNIRYTIMVVHRLTELKGLLRARFPREQISLESSRGSLLVTGAVSSEGVRSTVLASLQAAVGGSQVIDRMNVVGSNAIRLDVLLLEVSRSQAENFGIDWNATVAENGFSIGVANRGTIQFGTTDSNADSLQATVDVLVTNDVATIVQETSLSTVTGEQAEFTVGSEIPVPSFQSDENGVNGGNFQLDYKFIGTRLTFTPSVAAGNKLRLLIDSSLSSDAGQASSVNGNNFPTLTSRSFKTSVELRDRVPFVIAGISRADASGDIRSPRGGAVSRTFDAIFGGDSVARSSQELVVIVTPILDEVPSHGDTARRLPQLPSNLDYIFSNTASGKNPGINAQMPGAAGFKY